MEKKRKGLKRDGVYIFMLFYLFNVCSNVLIFILSINIIF